MVRRCLLAACIAVLALLAPGKVLAAIVLEVPPAYDPELGGGAIANFHLRFDGTAAADLTVNVLDAAGKLASHAFNARVLPGVDKFFDWEGRDAWGKLLDPGSYTVRAEALTASGKEVEEAPLRLVRLGIVQIRFESGNGGEKYPLVFHRVSPGTKTPYPVPSTEAEWRSARRDATELSDLDDDRGDPRPAPAPWAQLNHPPLVSGRLDKAARNLPACFRIGSPIVAEVLLGREAVSFQGKLTDPAYPAPGLPLRLAAPGGKASGAIAPGDTVKVELGAARSALGREDRTIAWKFQAETGPGVWTDLPGQLETRHTIYTVFAAPPGNLNMPGPWLAVLDASARWADGLSDQDLALGAVTNGVHHDLGLRYESVAGAPYYTYGPLAGTELVLDAFLARSYGSRVNCTDCAALVTAYGGVLGIDIEMFQIGFGFYINYIRPLGLTGFTVDPFNQGGPSGFQMHTAATRDRAGHVFDATLALDDDGQPGFSPHKPILPMGLDFARYVSTLSYQNPKLRLRTKVEVK